MKAVLVGSNSSRRYLVGNIILGRQAFDPGDIKSCCVQSEGEVCGRRVTLVKAPGWLRGYDICNTPELFKTEAILSVSPGLHCFILVVNGNLPFKNVHKKTIKQHLEFFFGDKAWAHTIVVFSHSGHLDRKTVEDDIGREGTPLQALVEACGNRYHVLCEDDKDRNEEVKVLFKKIDAMVAENGFYEIDFEWIQNAESKRKEVDKRAEKLFQRSQQQRRLLRRLLTEPKLNLRILMVGWVFSGKSAAGNSILRAEVFHAGDRTVKALRQSGTVAGREVVIVDTPGWWKFFPPTFTHLDLKSEILKGVSLCSPSPNVILLTMPFDTSFTEEQRRITETYLKLLGERVWRHVIVLFTFGNALGDKTIEQHIESEGQPLCKIIEKCGNRYHVLDNTSAADDQVTELLEKMEEMVAGNSCFYLSGFPDAGDPQPREERIDKPTEKQDKGKTKITEQLTVEWDRRNWEKISLEGSMGIPPNMNDDQQNSEVSEEWEEQKKLQPEEQQCEVVFGVELGSNDDPGSESLTSWRILLEKEWSRRQVAMEQAFWRQFHDPLNAATSEPESKALRSRENVRMWLKTLDTASGYETTSISSGFLDEDINL